MVRPTRRECLIGIGGITTSAIAVSSLTETSGASSLTVDGLDIPNASKAVTNPVNGVPISVSGSMTVEAGDTPTKIVLRFECKRSTSGQWTQIGATDWRNNLSQSFSSDFSVSGNLLACPNITAPDLSPTEIGETKTLNIDARVVLQVLKDAKLLESHTVKDSATIEVSREQAQVNITLNAQGSIEIQT